MNTTYVAARPSGYPGGRNSDWPNKKSCIVRKIWDAKKWSFVERAAKNPVYGYRAWKHFCAIPVMA